MKTIYKNFHYVYRITNIVIKKYYYGSRSCNCLPNEDIGIHYLSSSRDKEFIKEQKEHPERFKYKVVRMFENRNDADMHEIFLHRKFRVDLNERFYNSSIARKSPGRPGMVCIKGIYYTKDEFFKDEELRQKHHHKGTVMVIDNNQSIFRVKRNDERYLNGELKSVSKGMVTAIDKNGKSLQVTTSEYRNGEYTTYNKNFVICFNIKTGKDALVKTDEYLNNDDLILKRENDKLIHIFDSDNHLVFECRGNFSKICEKYKLPYERLKKSYINNGRKIFNTEHGKYMAKKKHSIDYINKFSGWYAKKV